MPSTSRHLDEQGHRRRKNMVFTPFTWVFALSVVASFAESYGIGANDLVRHGPHCPKFVHSAVQEFETLTTCLAGQCLRYISGSEGADLFSSCMYSRCLRVPGSLLIGVSEAHGT